MVASTFHCPSQTNTQRGVTSPLFFIVHLISSYISPFLFIYYLSILVEVLLCLLTYRGGLVLLYLVSEDHS
jgi:hypothetical protein